MGLQEPVSLNAYVKTLVQEYVKSPAWESKSEVIFLDRCHQSVFEEVLTSFQVRRRASPGVCARRLPPDALWPRSVTDGV